MGNFERTEIDKTAAAIITDAEIARCAKCRPIGEEAVFLSVEVISGDKTQERASEQLRTDRDTHCLYPHLAWKEGRCMWGVTEVENGPPARPVPRSSNRVRYD